MDIKTLKCKIENKDKSILDSPLILKYDDCKFICEQYIDSICKYSDCERIYIDSLEDIVDDDFFDSSTNYVYIYIVENLQEDISANIKNLIVIAKNLPKNLSVDYTDIPKLLNWQIEDFVATRLDGLTKEQIHWLCEIAKYNVYRLDNECKKIEIFNKNQQQIIFNNINEDNGYCDLNFHTIFNFTNAIMQKDWQTLAAILENISYIDIEPTGVVTILLQQFTYQLEANFANTWNANMSCSAKQFNYFKHNPNIHYSRNQLVDIYRMLTEIDYKLKSGKLDNKYILPYILTHILNSGKEVIL